MTKIALRVEACEDRVVPSATIDTGYEAYSWVLINTLRSDPAGFADNLQGLVNGTVPGAFGFGKGDPVVADLRGLVNRALYPANYGASLALMRSTPPAGPFAWDEVLEYGANAHTRWMKANGFAHTGTTGGRVAIPGFDKNESAPPDEWGYGYPTFSAWGEDIAWAVGAARNIKAAYVNEALGVAGLRQREAFLDTVAYLLELNSSSLGHLQSLLARDGASGGGLPAFNAIGIDTDLYQAPPAYEAQDGVPEAWVSTHRLGLSRPDGSGGYVAGVAFQDSNGNGFYDLGEGAELTVDIRNPAGAGVTVSTDEQGAFSEYLPNGTYTARFSSNGRLLDSRAISINNSNAWADLAFGRPALSSAPTAARVASAPAGPDSPDSIDLAEPTVTGPAGTQGTLRPTATWTGVEGATGFQVRVDDLTSGATDLFPGVIVTKQDWTPAADLVSGRTYRFWVRAVRGDEAGPWGNPSEVTVDRPALIGPADGTTSVRPTFTWNGIGGAAAYEVRLNDVSAGVPALYVQRVWGTSWTPPDDLVSGRTYTWQVRALNAAGRGAWTAPESVTLGRPTLFGPDGDTYTRRPTFTWGGVAFAPGYQLRIDDLTAGDAAVYSATTGRLDWTPPEDLIVDHTYRWFVRALNADGLGAWSAPRDFRVTLPLVFAAGW